MRRTYASTAMDASRERDELLEPASRSARGETTATWTWRQRAIALAMTIGVGLLMTIASASNWGVEPRAELRKSFKCAVLFKPQFSGFRICNSQWTNAGDLLGEPVVRELLERHFQCDAYAYITHRMKSPGANCLWSVGSMMQYVHSGDVVWGLGVWHADEYAAPRLGTPLDFEVRGVRGPETAHLLHKVHGVHVNPIGDPAFLVSELFPEIKPSAEYKCLIRHISGDKTVPPEGVRDFTPGEDWRSFVEQVARCSHVYSSSLHGLVVADAFGIPSRWFFPEDQNVVVDQSDFKYRDWLEMTGRGEQFLRPRHDVNGVLDETSYATPINTVSRRDIIDKLVSSFPFDMFYTKDIVDDEDA